MSKCGGLEGSGRQIGDIEVTFDSMDYIMTDSGECLAVGKTETCSNYAYSREEMNVTITTENDLVCSQGKVNRTSYIIVIFI